MRRKTESKRQEILAGAARVFERKGFQGATLNDVARDVGCSKVTIYNYFASREDLLKALLVEGYRPALQFLVAQLTGDAPIEDRLKAFARTYLSMVTNDYSVRMLRLMIAEGERYDFSSIFANEDALDIWMTVRLALEREESLHDRLRGRDAASLMQQLRALLHGGAHYQHLIGAAAAPGPELLAAEANHAVDLLFGVGTA